LKIISLAYKFSNIIYVIEKMGICCFNAKEDHILIDIVSLYQKVESFIMEKDGFQLPIDEHERDCILAIVNPLNKMLKSIIMERTGKFIRYHEWWYDVDTVNYLLYSRNMRQINEINIMEMKTIKLNPSESKNFIIDIIKHLNQILESIKMENPFFKEIREPTISSPYFLSNVDNNELIRAIEEKNIEKKVYQDNDAEKE